MTDVSYSIILNYKIVPITLYFILIKGLTRGIPLSFSNQYLTL
jgi:hypothetical protein